MVLFLFSTPIKFLFKLGLYNLIGSFKKLGFKWGPLYIMEDKLKARFRLRIFSKLLRIKFDVISYIPAIPKKCWGKKVKLQIK